MSDNGAERSLLFQFLRRLWAFVPLGGSLPEDVWQKRHRFLSGLTWFHALIIALVGPILGYSWELSLEALFRDGTVIHTVGEGLIVALFAALASWRGASRTFQATTIGLGLISSSAILVHLSGGYIEFHFHFFVMLVFLALYQDWLPYILAIAYVAIHHGVVGVLWPEEVYNHPSAFNAPWTWAGIHAFFVLWASVGSVVAWRFNETAFARTKLILDSAGEGIYGLDLKGRVTFVNPTAARMLGWGVRELLGQGMHDILNHSRADGTPCPREECPLYATFRDGGVHHVRDEAFWRKDGTSFFVEYVSTPIFERGQLTGAVVTFSDISQRKQAEDELAQKAAELARSNAALQQFAYVASHDLQEPLGKVAGYVQLLARRYKGKLDADTDGFISHAADGARRMQALINALLAYSRIDAEGKDFQPTNCKIIFDAALASLKAAIEESRAVVTHDPLPTVMADVAQLGQLIQNLVGNAIKFRGEEPPRVHVSSKRSGKEWLFSVRDYGIGIDPQYAERMFVIFQRLDTTGKYPGSGIGLALCKKIAERHGGRIWVESQPGKGSTFYFTIPA